MFKNLSSGRLIHTKKNSEASKAPIFKLVELLGNSEYILK